MEWRKKVSGSVPSCLLLEILQLATENEVLYFSIIEIGSTDFRKNSQLARRTSSMSFPTSSKTIARTLISLSPQLKEWRLLA